MGRKRTRRRGKRKSLFASTSLSRQAHPLARRLHLEELEDRRMLAVITVTSPFDNLIVDGEVTLREAIQAANTDERVDSAVAGSGADGGGIYSFGDVTLNSSTITDNRVDHASATGGGIWNFDDPITITNSIVADNTAGGGSSDIRPGTDTFSVNYSLIGTGVSPDAGTSGNNVVTNDPMLGPLADNGGPTETHALLSGSPAIDAGDPAIASPPPFDQRGTGFDRVRDGDGNATAVIDIGAFEVQPIVSSADFDPDGDIDGADFLAWQRGFGTPGANMPDGDANDDNNVDGVDLSIWESQFGSGSNAVAASTSAAPPAAATAPVLAVQQSLEEPENVAASITTSAFSPNMLLQLGGFGQSFAPVSSQISLDGSIEREKDKVFHDLPDRRSSFSSDLFNFDQTDVAVQALATAEPESRADETLDHAFEQLTDDALTGPV